MIDLIGNVLIGVALVASLLMLLPVSWLIFRARSLQKLCERCAAIFDHINKAVFQGIMWFGLAMVLVQVAIVVMRYVFGINFIWLQESIVYMFGFLFLTTAGYALLIDEHVRVDIFYRDAPPFRKALTDFVGTYLFLFPVCILIVWAAGPYVSRSWNVLEGSTEASGIQAVFLLKSLVPIFAVFVAMAGFSLATRSVRQLIGARTEA